MSKLVRAPFHLSLHLLTSLSSPLHWLSSQFLPQNRRPFRRLSPNIGCCFLRCDENSSRRRKNTRSIHKDSSMYVVIRWLLSGQQHQISLKTLSMVVWVLHGPFLLYVSSPINKVRTPECHIQSAFETVAVAGGGRRRCQTKCSGGETRGGGGEVWMG